MPLIALTPSGEIAIKSSRSRRRFERILIKNIGKVIRVKSYKVDQGIIILNTDDDYSKLSKVFGISKYFEVYEFSFSSIQDIVNFVKDRFSQTIKGKKFAVKVKRVGNHSFNSMDVTREIGNALYPYSLGVDLENPDVKINLILRQDYGYVYTVENDGPRGFPVGSTGKTVVLFSGGFDSPVATWMLMKRGVRPILLNFELGGKVQRDLVLKEVDVLKQWSSNNVINVYFINGLDITSKLVTAEPSLRILLLKRIMYNTARVLANKLRAYSITTGESLSQVSSQTMINLYVTEYDIHLPVFRPLIGFDKEEIIHMSRKIGTFEYSSKLPEYCIISTKSIVKSQLNKVLEEERKIEINYEELIKRADLVRI
ncbi:tRNA sulfurtransferase [Sulfolobus acidocaldarius SUSAZ]|nr:tRNA sulfurtransferase [Sulfolobus acidocaldarius SUSAZ]